MKKILLSISAAMLIGVISFAQEATTLKSNKINQKDWQHASIKKDSIYGVDTKEALEFLKANNRKPSEIIVGVLDSGVEITHPDLKNNIWINTKEIAGNGKDDDKNGYIDDVNGWNFIGNKNGQNVKDDTLEITRLYAKYYNLFEKADGEKNRTKFPGEYTEYQKIKTEFENKLANSKKNYDQFNQLHQMLTSNIPILLKEWGDQELNQKNIASFQPKSKEAKDAMLLFAMVNNSTWEGKTMQSFTNEISNEINEALKHYKSQLDYSLNQDFNPRPIVGDDYSNVNERIYGNNDADGPSSVHGTHVSGIIAAKTGNGIGMDGIAGDGYVKIMSVRAVPDGDERDKDVANSIRYAVDNGAKILNMSFGKGYSPDKKVVWDAFKYAEKKGVLLIKAAGNDNLNIDTDVHFPTVFDDNGNLVAQNVITVGANTMDNKNLKASFSNFGKKSVDVFAPGLNIYSTVPHKEGEYKNLSGTSMASPVVAGVAALVWAHYPKLTVQQLKQVILDSVNKNSQLTNIAVTGGVVDAYKAVQLAEKIYKEKRLK